MKKKNDRTWKVTTFSLLMAGSIISSPVMQIHAAAGDVPSDLKTTQVQVYNVEKAANVTAYRIVKPVYNEEGFVKFTNIPGVTLSNPETPAASEITAIVQGILAQNIHPDKTIALTGQGNRYTGNLPAGEYIVLVTDTESADTIYNPMVVSAFYEDANEADSLKSSAPLDASGKFASVYAKKNTISLDKTILSADGVFGVDDDGTTDGAQGDDLGIGDTASFRIGTKIPQYTDAYKAKGVIYQIEDSQDDGFNPPTDIIVKVGNQIIESGEHTFTQTMTGNDFILDFESDFVLKHSGQDVIVEYKAVLNQNAKEKLEKNVDSVTLTYTNDVYDRNHVDTLQDDVAEYTFPLQLKKISAIDGQNTNGGQPIEGAEFTLKRKDSKGKTGTDTFKVVTDAKGIAQFDRLDEGSYLLQETKAPAGYAINPDQFQITILPVYAEDGTLEQYTISMINLTKNIAVGDITIDSADDDILAGNITDSRLQTLPSTGGQGRKIFVILAAGFSGLTLGLLALSKKKEHEMEI